MLAGWPMCWSSQTIFRVTREVKSGTGNFRYQYCKHYAIRTDTLWGKRAWIEPRERPAEVLWWSRKDFLHGRFLLEISGLVDASQEVDTPYCDALH